ncbi:MAG: hypothetical protein ACRYHA_10670 [Janthinobacterium lividum]
MMQQQQSMRFAVNAVNAVNAVWRAPARMGVAAHRSDGVRAVIEMMIVGE